MTRLRRALLLVMLSATTAAPCGGPETYPINAPLATIDAQFEAVQTISDGFESRTRPELRFLAPFRGTRGVTDALWSVAYPDGGWNPPPHFDSTATFPVPDTAPLHAAIRRGDTSGADAAAREVLDRILDLPASVADAHIATTERAVAWLERSSHGASSEFALIKRTMRERIPNGWTRDIRDSVRAETWSALAELHAQWLKAHGAHPLVPWVRFSRARLAYFQGDAVGAWEPWIALYATGAHRPRVLSEMRYLMLQSTMPPADRRLDALFHAAMLGSQLVSVAEWNREWGATAALAPGVRTAVQERLLWQAANRPLGDSLDRLTSFPREAARPTAIWAEMRALALARAGHREAALAQLQALDGDSLVAPLRAQLLLGTGRWADGIRTPAIPFASRLYLMRVMAPDSVVSALASGSERRLADEARLVQAVHLAAAGEWTRGIAVLPTGQSRRGALWRTAATLSRDTTSRGQLAWARWLRQQNGSLFFGNDKPWYRSLNWRLGMMASTDPQYGFNPQLPWSPDEEGRAIGQHFRETFELYSALRTWVAWLARPDITPVARRRVAREADAAYRWLVDWDANNSNFWKVALETEGIGRAIRVAAR